MPSVDISGHELSLIEGSYETHENGPNISVTQSPGDNGAFRMLGGR